METSNFFFFFFTKQFEVGNPLLSERDGNHPHVQKSKPTHSPVGNPLLSERDGNVPVRRE